jgi:hypothetical protein
MADITFNSWQVYDLTHYETFAMDNMADADLTVSLLIPLDSAHRNNGAFRIVTYGGETETVPILVEDLFPSPPDSLKGLYVNVPCSTACISFPVNSTASWWEDIESMIRNVEKMKEIKQNPSPPHPVT